MNGNWVRSSLIALLLLVLIAFVPNASADQVTWHLSEVTFSAGGSASGSFTYDADTNTFSSINITVIGSPFGNDTYRFLDPGFPSSANVLAAVPDNSLADFTNTPILGLVFGGGLLTDAGGTIPLITGNNGIQQCENSICSGSNTLYAVTGGEVTTSSVLPTPEPSSLLFLGAGFLCFLAAFRIHSHFTPLPLGNLINGYHRQPSPQTGRKTLTLW